MWVYKALEQKNEIQQNTYTLQKAGMKKNKLFKLNHQQ